MISFRQILVATDFSESAERAVHCAVNFAKRFDARIAILHACWLPPLAYAAFPDGLMYPSADLTKAAEKALEAILVEVRQECARVEDVIVVGEPRSTVLAVARDRGADLIVMGTHGRRGFSHMLLGSVAQAVVRLSPIPVLTVP